MAKRKAGKLYDLNNLQLAKVHRKNLKQIQTALYRTVTDLKPYLTYRSVQRIIGTIHDELMLIDAHLTQFEKIEETKGEIKDEQ